MLPRFRGLIASASLKHPVSLKRMRFSASIPRLDCLGLIEAGVPPRAVRVSVLIPRLDCLGLIEAWPGALASSGTRWWIPRLDCLGLIEAQLADIFARSSEIGFRGLIASASLKPAYWNRMQLNDGPIPRLDCLGLIEATAFRRIMALIDDHRFRGLIASASLKQELAEEKELGFSLIPRLDCLGLIEAQNATVVASTSELPIPRLDCLGLIEATVIS